MLRKLLDKQLPAMTPEELEPDKPWSSRELPCHGCGNSAAREPFPGFSSGESACADCLRNPFNKGRDGLKDMICSVDRGKAWQDAFFEERDKWQAKYKEFVERGRCAQCEAEFDYLCPDCREEFGE